VKEIPGDGAHSHPYILVRYSDERDRKYIAGSCGEEGILRHSEQPEFVDKDYKERYASHPDAGLPS